MRRRPLLRPRRRLHAEEDAGRRVHRRHRVHERLLHRRPLLQRRLQRHLRGLQPDRHRGHLQPQTPGGSEVVLSAGVGHNPDIAFQNGRFGVLWTNQVNPQDGAAIFRAVEANGVPSGAQAIISSSDPLQLLGAFPLGIVAYPSGFLAIWQQAVNGAAMLRLRALDSLGTPSSQSLPLSNTPMGSSPLSTTGVAAAWSSGANQLGAVWMAFGGSAPIRFSRANSLSAAGDTTLLNSSQLAAEVAVAGRGSSGNYGVVSAEEGVMTYLSVSSTGAINSTTSLGNGDHPSLAWSGSEFGFAFVGAGGVTFRRIDANGGPIGPSLTLGSGARPNVIFAGDRWLVSWSSASGIRASPPRACC